MEILAWCLGIVGFLLVLLISIGLHEAGHMSVAKMFKLHVPKFFVGFGKTLWSKQTAKTEYGIKAIPLGGFVRIEDENSEEGSLDRVMLSHIKPWKRNLVYVAGPAVNIILGTIILISMMLIYPGYVTGNTVDIVNDRSAASEAGLVAGDTITAVNGTSIDSRDELVALMQGEESVALTVQRDGDSFTTDAAPRDGMLGVTLNAIEYQRGLGEAFVTMGDLFMVNFEAVTELPSKVPVVFETLMGAERDPESPVSMITIGNTYGTTAADTSIPPADKMELFLMYSGLLNIGLGIVNLLPFMPLDGGRILIAFMDSCKLHWSKLRKKTFIPVSQDIIGAMTIVNGAMVVVFMLLLFITDIVLIGRGEL